MYIKGSCPSTFLTFMRSSYISSSPKHRGVLGMEKVMRYGTQYRKGYEIRYSV